MDTTEQAIQAAGANVAPRVTPADIEANIASEHYFTAADGFRMHWLTEDHPKHDTRASVYDIASNVNVRSYASTCASIDAVKKTHADLADKVANMLDEAAEKAANFLETELKDGSGRLLHRWREGEAAASGSLLQEAAFSLRYLRLRPGLLGLLALWWIDPDGWWRK